VKVSDVLRAKIMKIQKLRQIDTQGAEILHLACYEYPDKGFGGLQPLHGLFKNFHKSTDLDM
jgi:hypothetical protein